MNRVAHASGKAALNMLTQTMALELAQHEIRVNAIGMLGYILDKVMRNKTLQDTIINNAIIFFVWGHVWGQARPHILDRKNC